jgi:alpha-tubulin suppressor-like RCC1 family protein
VLKWEYHCSNQEMPICDIGPAHPIIGVKNATAISRYGDYGLVLERDGSVWGLGEDRDGQITGSAGGSRNQKPTKRMLSRPLMQIAAGWNHSVAIDDQGQVWSWGGATHPAVVGEGETVKETDGSQSIKIANLPLASRVAAGVQTYSLDRDGHLWQWGTNTIVSKDGKITTGGSKPSVISGLKDVVVVSVSSLFTATLDVKGQVAIIGIAPGTTIHPSGDSRQGTYESEPAYITSLSGVKDISAGLDGLAIIDAKSQVLIFGTASNHGAPIGPLDIGN